MPKLPKQLRRVSLPLLALCCISFGCAPQVELIAPGHPFMVGKAASVYPAVPNGSGGFKVSGTAVTVPAGWYVVPPPTTQPETQSHP